MGEVTMNALDEKSVPVKNGLLVKVTSLFNNKMFSDIKFSFKTNSGFEEKIYGHKLILALGSKYFSHIFYDGKKDINEMEFDMSMKNSFYLLLKFLYTNDVEIKSIEEAYELCELAIKFVVEELELKCKNFLLKEEITIRNIFQKYDYILNKNNKLQGSDNEILLNKCRKYVCAETNLVLNKIQEATPNVIEDIIQLDSLSVSSELDVIEAVIKWCKTECIKSGGSLRECIAPYFRYLRFLTLDDDTFFHFVQIYNNLFTSYETMILTKKIMQPDCKINVPDTICSITTKRRSNLSILEQKIPENSETKIIDLKELSIKTVSQNLPPTAKEQSIKTVSQNLPPPAKEQSFETVPQNKAPPVNFAVRKVTSLSNIAKTPSSFSVFGKTKQVTSPLSQSYFTDAYFKPCSRSFVLLLKDPNYSNPFEKDLKCIVNFAMKRGTIQLTGIELKFLNLLKHCQDFEVEVSVKGFGKKKFNEVFQGDVKNEIFTIKLPENMDLKENDKGLLEVSIDNFSLSYCKVVSSQNQNCELNNGLKCTCQMTLSSNQKCGNDFFFLIHRLLYST